MTRVPFSFDSPHGMVTTHGTVSLEADALVIETRQMLLDLVFYRRDTFVIPAREVASIEVERGMVSQKLIIRPFSFDLIDGFPGDPTDALALPIKRKHYDAAEALARGARHRNMPL